MSYSRSRSYRRPAARAITPGRFAKANARPGPCHYCGATVTAGRGQLYRETDQTWAVAHLAAEWHGSPVSGWYINGCPADTAAHNAAGGWGPESARVFTPAAPVQADPEDDLRAVSRRAGSKYAYTADGARMTMSSQRCIDAPCCGCCD